MFLTCFIRQPYFRISITTYIIIIGHTPQQRGNIKVHPKKALCKEAQNRSRGDRTNKGPGTQGTYNHHKRNDQHQGKGAQKANTKASAEATQSKLKA